MALAIDSNVLAALIGGVAVVAVGILTTLLNKKVVVATAREAARLSQRNAIDNQVWKLRREGYSVVVAKLGEASKHASSLEDGFCGPGGSPEQFFDSERYTKLRGKMWDAWADCRSEFDKNRLTCSELFAERFRQIHESLSDGELRHFHPSDLAREEAACFRNAHSDLLAMAIAELGLKREDETGAPREARA